MKMVLKSLLTKMGGADGRRDLFIWTLLKLLSFLEFTTTKKKS